MAVKKSRKLLSCVIYFFIFLKSQSKVTAVKRDSASKLVFEGSTIHQLKVHERVTYSVKNGI